MSPAREPAYRLADLISACEKRGAVVVSRGALETARRDFGLLAPNNVLDFVFYNGLEKPVHVTTLPWENNPNPGQVVWVDAYQFYSGLLFGYFAFFLGTNGRWIIKSFKKNDRPDSRFLTMKEALSKIQL